MVQKEQRLQTNKLLNYKHHYFPFRRRFRFASKSSQKPWNQKSMGCPNATHRARSDNAPFTTSSGISTDTSIWSSSCDQLYLRQKLCRHKHMRSNPARTRAHTRVRGHTHRPAHPLHVKENRRTFLDTIQNKLPLQNVLRAMACIEEENVKLVGILSERRAKKPSGGCETQKNRKYCSCVR